MINQTISHYKILEKLGQGGMGVVYKALDTRLNRQVALKFLPQDLTRDQETIDRFINEAQTASALDHANICTIHEIGETEEGQMFIVMAYYAGETLQKKVVSGQLSVDSVIDIVMQVARGLERAHEAGITHRDIKPSNLVITPRGEVKIIDFGLAKLVGQTRLTKTGSTLGTVAYMSPEQVQAEAVDHRTDIWSLGVVLYEMLTGKLPFRGDYEAAMLYTIVNEKPEALAKHRTDVPEGLQQVLDQALVKDVEARYQHIDELLADLKGERKTGSTSTKPRSRVKSGKIKRSMIAYASVFVVAILVMVLGVWIFSRQPAQIVQPKHQQVTFTGDATYPAISPDGQFIAYVTGTPRDSQKVLIQDLAGGQTLNVYQAKMFTNLRWSPDGAELAFTSDSLFALYVIPRLGGEARSIPSYELQAWSPDGSQLASSFNNLKSIQITNKETHERVFIPLQDTFQWKPYVDWSPLGDRFLFVTESPNEYAIWTVKSDGSQQQQVVKDNFVLRNARWAANGKAIYYLQFDGETSSLMKAGIDPETGKVDGRPENLIPGLSMGDYFTVTKDNKRLLYAREINSRNLHLVTLHKEADKVAFDTKQLTTGTSWIDFPAISPDGKQIVFSIGKRPRANLYIMPIDGGQMKQLTFLNSYNSTPAWSPDGKEIVFGSTQDGKAKVWRISAQGGTPRAFINSELSYDEFEITWSPGSNILYSRPGNTNFHFLDPETEEEKPLLKKSLGWIFVPQYSSDGNSLALYSFNGQDQYGLSLISLDDGASRFLLQGFHYPLKWSNDGNWIYGFTYGTVNVDIIKISKDGGEPEVVVTLPWKIRDSQTVLTMSPDEKQIVVPDTYYQSDVWLVENFDPENEPERPVIYDNAGLQQLAFLQKGETLYRGKKYNQAESVFREGLQLRRQHSLLSKQLGKSLQMQSKHVEAEKVFREAGDLFPEDDEFLSELGWSLHHQHKNREALTFAEKALAADTSFANLNLIARVLVAGGIDLERGMTMAEKAVAAKPRGWSRWAVSYHYLALPEHTLGLAYLKKGDFEKAVQHLEQAIEFAGERQAIRVDLQLARQKLQAR